MKRIIFTIAMVLTVFSLWAQGFEQTAAGDWNAMVRMKDEPLYWEYSLTMAITPAFLEDAEVEILWELTDTNQSGNRQMNNVSVWKLEGSYSQQTRTLRVEELSKEDPNGFISEWWQTMEIVFNTEGNEFVARMYKTNGNPVRDGGNSIVEIIGKRAEN